jgi:hypothetical protein
MAAVAVTAGPGSYALAADDGAGSRRDGRQTADTLAGSPTGPLSTVAAIKTLSAEAAAGHLPGARRAPGRK